MIFNSSATLLMTDRKNQPKKRGISKKQQSEKTIPEPRLNNVVKPEKMSLEEWQRALRRQVAEREMLGVQAVDAKLCPGEYRVFNPKSKEEYKVVYRGENSSWNYCSCMDFKTSQLGTCKHLEAVSLKMKGRRTALRHPAGEQSGRTLFHR